MFRSLIPGCFVFLAACVSLQSQASVPVVPVPASAETATIPGPDDRADDPAIWVDGDRSLVLGTDKQAGLRVYDLSGRERQFLAVGTLNNVDLRGRFAVASNDGIHALSWFEITGKEAAPVRHIGDTPLAKADPYGICLARDDLGLIVAVTYRDGHVSLWRATIGNDGEVRVRGAGTFSFASKLEGCVFDEVAKRLFVGEEAVGIWSLDYTDLSTGARVVDTIANGNGLVEDVEGLSIWRDGDAGYLVASAQAADRFVVYDRLPPYRPYGVFTITGSVDGSVDGVSHTDGLDVTAMSIPGYPRGLLVVQDDANPDRKTGQNFKLVDWQTLARALDLPRQ